MGRSNGSVRGWSLDTASRELLRNGERRRLAEKPFRVLLALMECEGDVVTRGHLQKLLWSDDTFVDFDNNLNSAVATLRHILGDSAKSPTQIETIPKVGYRLIAKKAQPPLTGRRAGRFVAAAAVMLVSTLAVVFVTRGVRNTTGATLEPSQEVRSLVERGVYLRGQSLMSRAATSGPDLALLTDALAAFVEAGRRDPTFAGAAAEEAETLVEMSFSGAVPFRDGLSQAREAARRAIALTASNGTAARVIGITTLFLDWDAATARTWIDRARASLPDAKTSLAAAMWFAATGNADLAVESAERAVALDPAAYFVRADLAMFFLGAGRNTEAAAASQLVLSVAPHFTPAMAYALLAHERLGQWPEAATQARALMAARGASVQDLAEVDGAQGQSAVLVWRRWDLARLEEHAGDRRTEFALDLALRHAMLGNRAAAFSELQLAFDSHNARLAFLRSYPELVSLRGDPAFETIARAVTGQG